MSDVKWIKITTNMFDDEKIKLIESMPDKDSILVIWIKLLIQAGKTNINGYVLLNENIPYTDEMLATIFNRPLNTVRLALDTFKRFGMIEMDEDEGIYIKNWDKHQSIDKLNKIKEQRRLRQEKYRKKQELKKKGITGNVTVTLSNGTDIDIDIDKEEDKDINNSSDSDPNPITEIKFDEESAPYKAAVYLRRLILRNNPRQPVPEESPAKLEKWAEELDRLNRLGPPGGNQGYEWREIGEIIKWCQDHSFWKSNILSASKFRQQITKLENQMKNDGHNDKYKEQHDAMKELYQQFREEEDED